MIRIRAYRVDSTNIKGIAYNPYSLELYVKFKSGVYKYTNVEPDDVIDLMFAKSIGKEFNGYIKLYKQCEKVNPNEAVYKMLEAL